jgi:hypothetical protein
MKNLLIIIQILLTMNLWAQNSDKTVSVAYPFAELSNKEVKLQVYLPDTEKGYYRGTRFDWAGIISSMEYQGHQYFGEWSKTRDPLGSSDITGPVNGYLAPGLGYAEAVVGGEFIRIGVGAIEKIEEKDYGMFKTYKIIDNGKWTVKNGKDWIEFTQEIKRETGYGFIYSKRIELTKDQPGFKMSCTLKNTGSKTIETDQFNHNFFIIDKAVPGPDYTIKFPFPCVYDDNPRNASAKKAVTIQDNALVFAAPVERMVWMSLKGYKEVVDNQFEIVNNKTGAGVKVTMDVPLFDLNFYANNITFCPETFIFLKVLPGQEMKWSSNYSLFTVK